MQSCVLGKLILTTLHMKSQLSCEHLENYSSCNPNYLCQPACRSSISKRITPNISHDLTAVSETVPPEGTQEAAFSRNGGATGTFINHSLRNGI